MTLEDRLVSNIALAGFETGWSQFGYWLTLYPLLLAVAMQRTWRKYVRLR